MMNAGISFACIMYDLLFIKGWKNWSKQWNAQKGLNMLIFSFKKNDEAGVVNED